MAARPTSISLPVVGKQVKIAIVGPGGVGKTSVTVWFMSGAFKMEYDPTRTESFRKDGFIVDGQQYCVDLLDTAGQEGYDYLFPLLRDQDGVLMVFSLADSNTLDELQRFHDAIRDEEEISGPLPRLLLANKSDLVMQRQVQPETVKAAAQRFGCKYLETSARNGVGIDQAFETLIREIGTRIPRKPPPAPPKPTSTCGCALL